MRERTSGLADHPELDWGKGTQLAAERALMRLTDAFVLRSVDAVRDAQNGEPIKILIWTAIWTANVRHLINSPASSEYGRLDSPPPDEMRKPISVLALSNSLNIPYETVRRHSAALVASGYCQRIDRQGLVVPAAMFSDPGMIDYARKMLAATMRFLGDLHRVRFDFGPAMSKAPAMEDMVATARAGIRLHGELMVHEAERLGKAHGNYMTGLIYMIVLAANLDHVVRAWDGEGSTFEADLGSDELRRPVTVLSIADSLRMPYETVRRHVNRMVREGRLAKTGSQGVIVPAEVQRRFEDEESVRLNHARIQRFVADLQRAGLPMPAR
ncbi:MAG: hypothetical protein P4L72_10090 [Parvibaculum sp.]|uniref:hypothetical protein n=1 Tax=Parvibaculum sp. TaxID=2024848 RepID=UPI0028402153|nr:hypothetical protein [Parvibaculum sp.]MDR3499564.1 hypothetical protein [Parvibaculum sp.]